MGRASRPAGPYRSSKELAMLAGVQDVTLLFDTCWSEQEFRHNLRLALHRYPPPDALAISHLHADHVRGIPHVLSLFPNLPVYVAELESVVATVRIYHPRFDPARVDFRVLKRPVTIITPRLKFLKLCIPGDICELYPAIKVRRGWVVLTGCGHSREQILPRTTELLGEQPYALIGGIHSWGCPRESTMRLVHHLHASGLQRIGSFHCCGEIFRREAIKAFGRDRMLDYRSLPMGEALDLDTL
jgi:metal-dependent hydrolase (beta-lactamase superfamily II)